MLKEAMLDRLLEHEDNITSYQRLSNIVRHWLGREQQLPTFQVESFFGSHSTLYIELSPDDAENHGAMLATFIHHVISEKQRCQEDDLIHETLQLAIDDLSLMGPLASALAAEPQRTPGIQIVTASLPLYNKNDPAYRSDHVINLGVNDVDLAMHLLNRIGNRPGISIADLNHTPADHAYVISQENSEIRAVPPTFRQGYWRDLLDFSFGFTAEH